MLCRVSFPDERLARAHLAARAGGQRRRARLTDACATPTRSRSEMVQRPRSQMGVAMPAPQADALYPYELTIVRRTGAWGETLVLAGEIDFASAPALERALRDVERAMPRRVVLDLAALDFLDSTALHLLIEAQRRAENDGHELILTHVPAHAQRLFALTGLGARLTIE